MLGFLGTRISHVALPLTSTITSSDPNTSSMHHASPYWSQDAEPDDLTIATASEHLEYMLRYLIDSRETQDGERNPSMVQNLETVCRIREYLDRMANHNDVLIGENSVTRNKS